MIKNIKELTSTKMKCCYASPILAIWFRYDSDIIPIYRSEAYRKHIGGISEAYRKHSEDSTEPLRFERGK